MNSIKKAFSITLLVLTLPIWILQMSVRNIMSFDGYWEFSQMVNTRLNMQLFDFEEVSNAGQFLTAIAGFAKFFEALIIPFCIVAAIFILRNSSKRKITLIPGFVLLSIVLFNLICIIAGKVINKIEIIDIAVKLLDAKNYDIDIIHPVINTISATVNSVLIAIPAIGFLVCGISDILYLKNNPEDKKEKTVDPKYKKACIFYAISAACVLALLLIASFISRSVNVATITWIFRYFWQGYFLLIIAAVIFYVIATNINPNKKDKPKKNKKAPVQDPVQQTSTADELKKYKELLDTGAITQEEYEAKKKELLGL